MKLTIEPGGKITLPPHLLALFGWEEGEELAIDIRARTLLLKKEIPGCHLCQSTRGLVRAGEFFLCRNCLQLLSEAEPGSVFYRR